MVKVWYPAVVVGLVAIPELTEKLENVSGLKFDTPYFVRKPSDLKFDDSLSAYIGVAFNFYVQRHELESNAASWSWTKTCLEGLLTHASTLHTTMDELARNSGTTSKWIRTHINSDLVGCNPNSQERDPFNALLEQVGHLRASLETTKEMFSNLFGGKFGRPQHEAIRELIRELADIFEAAGGVATAPNKPIKGKRDSPFLRFLHTFYSALPDHVRLYKNTALNEHAKRVLQERKELRSK